MRIYTDHNGLAVNAIYTLADGEDVAGHHYQLLLPGGAVDFGFQAGSVRENGVNGITSEAMIATLIHRITHQNGKFPCTENADAIAHLQFALNALDARTRDRIARGVDGKEAA